MVDCKPVLTPMAPRLQLKLLDTDQPFCLLLFFPLIGVEISTLWLDDGNKTYKKTEIKLSVKVIYSGTKEGEGGVGGVHTQQNWHPLPWTKTMVD